MRGNNLKWTKKGRTGALPGEEGAAAAAPAAAAGGGVFEGNGIPYVVRLIAQDPPRWYHINIQAGFAAAG